MTDKAEKNTVTQQNICYNKYWENCDVIIFLFILFPGQDCLRKNCLPSQDVSTTTEQESYRQCFLQFFKRLLLFLHLCLSFYLPFQEQTIPGVMVFVQTPACFCFASGGVRNHERERQREMKLPDRAAASPSDCRPAQSMNLLLSAVLQWMSALSLLCSALSISLFVSLACREVSVMAHHNMTLGNIDCSFQLSS